MQIFFIDISFQIHSVARFYNEHTKKNCILVHDKDRDYITISLMLDIFFLPISY